MALEMRGVCEKCSKALPHEFRRCLYLQLRMHLVR